MRHFTKKFYQDRGRKGGLKRRALSKAKRSAIAHKGWKTRRKNGGG